MSEAEDKRAEKAMKACKLIGWEAKGDDVKVTSNGKAFIMFFEKFFPDNVSIYDKFMIKKNSYENQLSFITRYVNFFIKFYDPDNEFALAYLKIKSAIDKQRKFTENNPNQLIELIYEILFSDSMVNKIITMVDENYLDDIESSDKTKKYLSNGKEKKHLESLEFKNIHVKILLRISFGIKIISPLLFHYAYVNNIKIDKNSDFIYNFYIRLFDIFSMKTDGIDMYNKLFVYIKAKVLENKSHNATIYDQRDIYGNDEYLMIKHFLSSVFISENIVKYKFNEHWDKKKKKYKENIIGFNKTIIKYQLSYFLKEQYTLTPTEVTSDKNPDGLSGMDKMEMNMEKIDEGTVILADVNVELQMQKIKEDNDFEITEDEVNYYMNNIVISDLQAQLCHSYWYKYFGSYRDTKLISKRDYIYLLLIMKKRLLMECGHEDNKYYQDCILPYIITGNLKDKVNTRIIRNNKFVYKVTESDLYKKLIQRNYRFLSLLDPDYIISILSQIINTTFTYVVYEDQNLLGKEIEYDDNKISDELLFLLSII